MSSLAVIFCLSACSDAPSAPGALDCDGRPVRMGVASSLREIAEGVTKQLAEEAPRIRIEPIFGASSTHARQLRLGAPFDVLVSADADLMNGLEAEGLIDRASTREIAGGRLILLGRDAFPPAPLPSAAGNPPQSQPPISAKIFLQKELKRVALPSDLVPLGRYARAWLSGQNLIEPLKGKLVTTEHARASLSAVEAGHVDLAFAYASDRRLLRRARFLGELDVKDYPSIRYVATRTTHAAKCRNAEKVLSAWSMPATQQALARAGFSNSEIAETAETTRAGGQGR